MVSVRLDKNQSRQADNLFLAWRETYNLLAPFGCSIELMGKSWKKCRDQIRAEKRQLLKDTTNHVAKLTGISFPKGMLPSWLWTCAMQSIITNRKSMEEEIIRRIKDELYTKYKMNAQEASVVFYVVKTPSLFKPIIRNHRFEPLEISNKDIAGRLKKCDPVRIHRLLTHAARRYRQYHKPVHTNKGSWMRIDKNGYTIRHEENTTIIQLMGLGKQEPFEVKLRGIFYTSKKEKTRGNLTVLYDREKNRLVFQRLVEVRNHPSKSEKNVGVDAGITSLLSTSNNILSAELKKKKTEDKKQALRKNKSKAAETLDQRTYKECFYPASDFLSARGVQRNRMRDRRKNLLKQADQEKFASKKPDLSPQEKKACEERTYSLLRKAERIRKNNTRGRKSFARQSRKIQAHLECLINEEIALVLKTDQNIGHIVMEDLDIRGAASKYKRMNRLLSEWMYGVLQERIEYKAGLKEIGVSYVNQAYSSQYCHICGAKVTRDKSAHEKAFCPVHKEMNADINAASNLVWIYENHPEITKWTPRESIKKLYEERIEQLKNQQETKQETKQEVKQVTSQVTP